MMLALLVWLFVAMGAPPSRICSTITIPTRSAGATLFVGRASLDTAVTGPGGKRWTTYPGMSANAVIRGQVMRVGRLAGPQTERLEAAFSRLGRREIIVVPWATAPDCSTIPWERSARWVRDTTTTAVFKGGLRPDSLWVNGVPVMDTDGEKSPYPIVSDYSWVRVYKHPEGLPALSAEEYFELQLALPTFQSLRQNPDSAISALEAWLAARQDMAKRPPVPEMLRALRLVAKYP